MSSHLPIFERPAMLRSFASSYSCSRFRSSRLRPALPPRARPRAACLPRSRRVEAGMWAIVRFRFAADCALRTFRFAACACFLVAIGFLLPCSPHGVPTVSRGYTTPAAGSAADPRSHDASEPGGRPTPGGLQRLVQSLRRPGPVHALAMADEHVLGPQWGERTRWEHPEHRMHAEKLVRGQEVRSGSERVGDHERAPLRPPERGLAPERDLHGAQRLERWAGRAGARHEPQRDAEGPGEPGAVAAMAVEQL